MIWQKAFEEAIKLGDQDGQTKILLNMSALYIVSESWSKADSLINLIDIKAKSKFSPKTIRLQYLTKMKLENNQGNYQNTIDLFKEFSQTSYNSDVAKNILTQNIWSELIIAKASLKKKYNDELQKLNSSMSSTSGRFYLLNAKVSLQSSDAE